MADRNILKNVITHIVNGTLEESLCRICLSPANGRCENIFTLICKADKEYCIADVLEKVCNIQISNYDNSVVCADCLITASAAYKFYLTSKCTDEVLHFYTSEIEKSIDSIDGTSEDENVCFLLPHLDVSKYKFDFDLEGISLHYGPDEIEDPESSDTEEEYLSEASEETQATQTTQATGLSSTSAVVIACDKGSRTEFYRHRKGNLVPLDDFEKLDYEIQLAKAKHKETEKQSTPGAVSKRSYTTVKERKKRSPMPFIECSRCPVQYRFVSKLKSHMKTTHDVDLYCCKVCSELVEGAEEFKSHSELHTEVFTCTTCGIVFKKRNTMLLHLRSHCVEEKDGDSAREGDGDSALQDNQEKANNQNEDFTFTCHICSKNYRSEISFESHLKKHEQFLAVEGEFKCPSCPATLGSSLLLARHARAEHAEFRCEQCARRFARADELRAHSRSHDQRYTCEKCSRSFVDARSLMWHTRLHDNVRPYKCEQCSKSFVTLSRRKQHALTAHSAAARRCPLCPARFHLRSMVNTHIKKVHLATNKRRNRVTRYSVPAGPPVPPQELSVEIQHDLLLHQIKGETLGLS